MVAHSDQAAISLAWGQPVLKYRATIREIGPLVAEFLPHGILIFFGMTAPAELREVSLIHDGARLMAELAAGDLLRFITPASQKESLQITCYRITAVGAVANANLAELGHLVVHFDAAVSANLPGTISVEPALSSLPPVGTIFELLGLEGKRE
ncbi:MAG: PTS glucitol/sorbitol transporter subunit IIA [Ktedonobacteraceae bacterium]|nr:PTS glucitol/sorbitol transporter subunit IIA [Ktedonobacteraceae bacterium]